jgi:uncharacterized protein
MPEVASYPPGAPCWMDLVATDRDAARDFYAELFGWGITQGHTTDPPYLVARQAGRTVAGISLATADGPPPGWTTYFSCADAADLSRRVRVGGGTVITPPAAEEDDGAVTTFRDPQGAVVGGWRPGRVAGAQLAGEPISLIWSELHTVDVATAIDFYEAILPLRSHRLGSHQSTLHVGESAVGSIREASDFPAQWLPYFCVRDVEDTTSRARERGAQIESEPQDSARGRWSRITDPQGGRFCAIAL